MILRDYEGGEIDVIEAVGQGEIEALNAGGCRLIRIVNGVYEQSLSVDENGQVEWEAVQTGTPWPTAEQFEAEKAQW